ncbi:glycosyltransferase family 2 protein [Verrucomicrobium sp. BvORR106]|uniref:glycosyltransferase family 2 protein n=1 Tax=Verrucomicrobium sp. BvORR106 TaxID=1403819 RepID=UPI0007C7AE3E|nr:glycosyltransferase family 2 protein [Verrucomicrobium sp. BvORR106]
MPESPVVLHAIEFPVERKLHSRKLTIHGWCFDISGEHLKGVRAKVGGQTFTARRKRPRPYLGYRYPNHTEAALSGFLIEVDLPRGRSVIRVECKRADGKWVLVEELPVSAPWIAWPWKKKDPGHDYATWVQHYDTIHPEDLAKLKREGDALVNGPVISVLLPVYNTPIRWLKRVIETVLDQAYPKWELCIADDASPDPQVRKVIESYAASDPRIKVVFRPANGHIVAATNSALELASGPYVALLDHDDELRPHALLEMAREIIARPDAVLIYSDEDHVDEVGVRYDPYFKPDFNYDLLLAQNCICHLGVYRTEVVRDMGGFRAGTEGAQDWDLALRIYEAVGPNRIHHIPKILYHWRSIEGSTARGVSQKSYASSAGQRVVEDHLARTCQSVVAVEELNPGQLRVRRNLSEPPPVAIIIPTRNFRHLLEVAVESVLARTDYPHFRLVIVDNDSNEESTLDYLASLQAQGKAEVIRVPGPFNYSLLNNRAVAACSEQVICLLNNDIEIHERDWLREMVSQAVRPDVGAVGTKLYYPDGRIQHAGVILGMGGAAGHWLKGCESSNRSHGGRLHLCQNFSAVTAACLVVERRKYLEVGGLDEGDFKVAFNDIDFCLKLDHAGYRNVYTPFAEMSHHESASRGAEERTVLGKERATRETLLLRRKWQSYCEADPAYNVNLSMLHEDGSLSFPPRVGEWLARRQRGYSPSSASLPAPVASEVNV